MFDKIKQKNTVKIKNKVFKSYADACRHFEINEKTFGKRVKKLGWTIEEALEIKKRKGKEYNINRLKFNSIVDASKHFRVDPRIVYARLNVGGWSLEEALNQKKRGKVVFTYKNRSFYNFAETARFFKLDPEKVGSRIRKGWSIEEALDLKKRQSNLKEIKFKNFKFKSLSDACKYFKVHHATASHRLRNGYTYEETFILKKKKKYVFNNKTFSTLAAASKYFNVPYEVVNQRVRKLKWSPEEALELKAKKDSREGVLGYVYKIQNSITKKIYIGATTQSPKERWISHKVDAVKRNSIKSDKTIRQSILKYGAKNFKFSVLKKIKTSIFDIQKMERKLIEKYNSITPNGYNQNRGGSIYFTHGIAVRYKGIRYKSLRQLASKFKLNYSLLASRVAKGYSIEKAIDEPVKFTTPIFTIKGKKFYMIKDVLKYLKIPTSTYEGRLQRGWSKEQALNLKKRF